jgi:hypothetical protein
MEDRFQALEQRLALAESKLERMTRQARWMRLLLAAGLACGALFLSTRPAATLVQAETLLRGGTRIKAPFLVVDRKGKPILHVTENSQGRGCLVLDAAGEVLAGIGQTSSNNRGLSIFDKKGKVIGGLGAGFANDDPTTQGRGLYVFDPEEKLIAGLGLGLHEESGRGQSQGRGLAVADQTGALVVGLGVWSQHEDRGQIVLTDRSGNILLEQPPLD